MSANELLDQLLRGKIVVLAGVLATGAVIVYAFIR
jgi:hypothetical protein